MFRVVSSKVALSAEPVIQPTMRTTTRQCALLVPACRVHVSLRWADNWSPAVRCAWFHCLVVFMSAMKLQGNSLAIRCVCFERYRNSLGCLITGPLQSPGADAG
eukprot:10244071-Alexandrium_andersonii.AAC.1